MARHRWSQTRFRVRHLTLTALFVARSAGAQNAAADKAAAEALFQQGIELMRVGKVAEACDKLEQSSSVEHGIGTSLYLAECYEKVGRTASAWGLFREASSEAQARGEAERAASGKRRADKLEPLLSHLTLQVVSEGRVPGLEISRDGSVVPSGLWNVAVPVDPGSHRLEAHAPGYADWAAVVNVDPNGANATATLPALLPAAVNPAVPPGPLVASVGPPSTASAPAATSNGASPSRDEAPHAGRTQRTVGMVAGGLGIVALGVGSYFGIRAVSENDDAKTHCPSGGAVCHDTTGTSLTEQAQSAARLANVFVIGGAVLAAGGAALFFSAPEDQAPKVAFSSDGRGARLTVGGAF